MFFVIGDVVGGGIYALVGTVVGRVGGIGWAGFAVALLIALLTAGSYAELTTKYSSAGGAARFVGQAFKVQSLSFIVGFAVLASGMTSAAALSRAFATDYLSVFVTSPAWLAALALISLGTAVNLVGLRHSVIVNAMFTLIELAGLLLIASLAIWAVGHGAGDPSNALAVKHGGEPLLLTLLAGGSLAFYALIGFEDAVNLAEEIKAPHRTFPMALIGGVAIAGLVYLLVTIPATMLVPADRLAEDDGNALLTVLETAAPTFPPQIFAVIGMFALANGVLLNLIMASRLSYGMADMELLPRRLCAVNRRGSPWVAIVTTAAITVALAAFSNLERLAGTTALLVVVVFTIVNITVLVLRRDITSSEHFRIPTPIPVLATIGCVAVLTRQDADNWLLAGGIVAAGAMLHLAARLAAGAAEARAGR